MGKRRGKHDSLVLELEGRLFNEYDYDKILKFWEYSRRGYVGEVDILAIMDGMHDFYEVKSNRTRYSVEKAQEQYSRFCKAFPKWKKTGYLYTPAGLEKITDTMDTDRENIIRGSTLW